MQSLNINNEYDVIEENDKLDATAFKKLIKAAVKINEERKEKK